MPLLFRRKSVRGPDNFALAQQQHHHEPLPVRPTTTQSRVQPSSSQQQHQLLHPANAAVPTPAPASAATAKSGGHSNRLKPGRSSSPQRPVSVGGYGPSASASTPGFLSSHAHDPNFDDGSDTDGGAPAPAKAKRFSLMRFRNFSESHLGSRSKVDLSRMEDDRPPVPSLELDEPPVPAIVKTAPTAGTGIAAAADAAEDTTALSPDKSSRSSRFKRASAYVPAYQGKGTRKSMDEKRSGGEKMSKPSSLRWRKQGKTSGLEDLHRLSTMNVRANQQLVPPSYGDESNSTPAVPVMHLATEPRFSESSRSDGSSGDIYASTTTTVSTHTTFFKLPKRNKNRNSLFPLPAPLNLPPPPHDGRPPQTPDGPATPRASTSAFSTRSYTPGTNLTPDTVLPTTAPLQRRHTEVSPSKSRRKSVAVPGGANAAALARGSLSFAEPGMNLFREPSHTSHRSNTSSPLQPPRSLGQRDRASTTSSLGRPSHDIDTPPPLSASGRTSTSTGRPSFGGLLNLSRFRNGSDPHSPRHGSPGALSKANSFAMSREALVIPEREEGEAPGKYLERLEAAISRSLIAGILSKSADPFAQAVLRSYTRRFPFFGEPIDMSLRKFLLEAELPKETQQVDRVIQAFADRYHECNPGIFSAPDQAYVIAFSIMMLHTDAFNKNNKRKMQKADYIKNTSGQGLSDDILACFYDNICYTPFVHYEEEVDDHGDRISPFQQSHSQHSGGAAATGGKLKSAIPGASDAVGKKPSGPVDPYNLLVDQKLDTLRPPIKESMTLDDPYHYTRTPGEIDMAYLERAFTHTGVLQIVSARSRPAAYENHLLLHRHVSNDGSAPAAQQQHEPDTQQGIVDLKITKVGVLWRKSMKKKKTRSPWSEWGAVLTGSQLYLFKNVHWAKGLLNQFTSQQKPNQPRTPVVFKPPIQDFKPDAQVKTEHAVALIDATYTRHKHAFMLVGANGQDEVFLADSENELADWLGVINYAAAFRAAGVRIRGMFGGSSATQDESEEQVRTRDMRRLNSSRSAHPTSSSDNRAAATTIDRSGLTPQLQRQVMAARRQLMIQKIVELDRSLAELEKQLEALLRNGRHLLVLAPIPPKSREDIVHAAARTDANLKWLRRDIWRLKAHRDFLKADVQLDGLSAAELERLKDQAEARAEAEKLALAQEAESKEEEGRLVLRPSESISSSHNATTQSQSPQQQQQQRRDEDIASVGTAEKIGGSPSAATTATSQSPPSVASPATTIAPNSAARMSHPGTLDDWMHSDVFRTPPESVAASSPTREGGSSWQLPPLNLDSLSFAADPHPGATTTASASARRPSAASTLLSASSHGTAAVVPASALSHTSSISSIAGPSLRTLSLVPTAESTGATSGVIAPAQSLEEKELALLARVTQTPEPPQSGTSGSVIGTPAQQQQQAQQSPSDSKQRVRRSLQKTLRDGNANAHGHKRHASNTGNKHRRGKGSDSTLRSGGEGSAAAAALSTPAHATAGATANTNSASSADATDPDRAAQEDITTPGLARDKPRFILHGKQASVVQFGGDWERMKLRRENYRDSLGQAANGAPGSAVLGRGNSAASNASSSLRSAAAGSTVADAHADGDVFSDRGIPSAAALARKSSTHTGTTGPSASSSSSARSSILGGLERDADTAASLAALRTSFLLDDDEEIFYDSFSGPSLGEASRRQTVIGPTGVAAGVGATAGGAGRAKEPDEDESEEDSDDDEEGDSDEEDDGYFAQARDFAPATPNKARRSTIIGPASPNIVTVGKKVDGGGAAAGVRQASAASSSSPSKTKEQQQQQRAAADSSDEDDDDEEEDPMMTPIDDEELWHLSQAL